MSTLCFWVSQINFSQQDLGEHSNPICRRLHLVGTTISVATFLRVGLSLLPAILPYNSYLTPFKLATPRWKLLLAGVVQAYMFAWVGHFFYEKNRPATFKVSIMGFIRSNKCLILLIAPLLFLDRGL